MYEVLIIDDLIHCLPVGGLSKPFSVPSRTLSSAPSSRILISKLSPFLSLPSLSYFHFLNTTALTGFINDFPTQWLSCRPYFLNNFLKDIQNRVLLVSRLDGTAYSFFSMNLESPIFTMVTGNFQLAFYFFFLLLFFISEPWLLRRRFRITHVVNEPITANISLKC